jgi:Ca2+-binding EF-hand superfamily protein
VKADRYHQGPHKSNGFLSAEDHSNTYTPLLTAMRGLMAALCPHVARAATETPGPAVSKGMKQGRCCHAVAKGHIVIPRIKTSLAVAALLMATVTSAALAERGGEGRGAMLLEDFDTMDADKDGKVTEAEISAHRLVAFKAADADADGLLSAAELVEMRKAREAMRAQRRAEHMIEKMDKDGDGNLSTTELTDMGSMPLFDRIDADQDGGISKAEAETALAEFREGRGRHDRHGKDAEN